MHFCCWLFFRFLDFFWSSFIFFPFSSLSATSSDIREWLAESAGLSSVLPTMPDVTLRRVFVRDEQSGRLIAVEGNGADISLVPFDEGNPGGGNYSQLEGIEFGSKIPRAGGMLHVLVAIHHHPPSSPSALQLYFDYPSFGSRLLDLSVHNERFPRGFAQSIEPGFVPAASSYRRHHAVFVFRSSLPLSNSSADIDRWMANSEGKLATLMMNNSHEIWFGQPVATFLYTLTTRTSLFPVSFDQPYGASSPWPLIEPRGNAYDESNPLTLSYESGLMVPTTEEPSKRNVTEKEWHNVNGAPRGMTLCWPLAMLLLPLLPYFL